MASRAARVCVVGSCNIDLIFRVPRLPRPGETLASYDLAQNFGGKGANQAVAAARLGARVTLVGTIGDEPFGRSAYNYLGDLGIDTRFLRTDADLSTGMAAVFVSADGENSIVVDAGANASVSAKDVRAAAKAIHAADLVLCQLETPVDAAIEAFRIARAAGVRTLLNPAPAAVLPDELLGLTDLCVPNETELELLTGLPVNQPGAVEEAARVLRERGPGRVIVTLGAAGALLLLDQAGQLVPSFQVNTVDATGAGDVFIAALAVSLAKGIALPRAVRRANAAAAVSVTRHGTQIAAPTRAEMKALLRSAPRWPPG